MIHQVSGKIINKKKNFVIIECGGLGLKVATTPEIIARLPKNTHKARLYCHLHVREDKLDLYGFLLEEELAMFELLIGISSIGPKSALGILNLAPLEILTTAIVEGKTELITKASGIGNKTAHRIVLELKNKITKSHDEGFAEAIEADIDAREALVGLGYQKKQAQDALKQVPQELTGVEDRLKSALKILAKVKH